jgi:hypothetical protein
MKLTSRLVTRLSGGTRAASSAVPPPRLVTSILVKLMSSTGPSSMPATPHG